MRRGGTDGKRLMWYEHVIANCQYIVLYQETKYWLANILMGPQCFTTPTSPEIRSSLLYQRLRHFFFQRRVGTKGAIAVCAYHKGYDFLTVLVTNKVEIQAMASSRGRVLHSHGLALKWLYIFKGSYFLTIFDETINRKSSSQCL